VIRPLAAALALVLLAGCSGAPDSDRGAEPASGAAPGGTAPSPEASAAEGESGSLATATITLYFPAADRDALVAETRAIVATSGPAERGTQILAGLLEGPTVEGAARAVPEGTTLRQLWVREDGTAYADFSDELARGQAGGSSDEILSVYAIVDSLTMNVPSIRRVGILVAGRERETLAGHLDIRLPLPPDRSLLPADAPAPARD